MLTPENALGFWNVLSIPPPPTGINNYDCRVCSGNYSVFLSPRVKFITRYMIKIDVQLLYTQVGKL